MQINVKADIDQATRYLNLLQRKQIPYATERALNTVAFDARKAVQVQLPKKLDRPTPWTVRGVLVKKAKKSSGVLMSSEVYFQKDRAKYMRFQTRGGIRTRERNALIVPKNIRLNKYGNMPRSKISTLLKKKDHFIGEINGVPGVWQRGRINRNKKFAGSKKHSTNLKLVARFEDRVSYRRRFPFEKIVAGVVRSKFRKTLKRELIYAIKTAK